MSRDGKCKIKILASKGGDQLTKLVTHDTFKIVILTKNSESVKYSIESKDSVQNIVTLLLTFNDPKKISSSTVSSPFSSLYCLGSGSGRGSS